MTGEARSGEGRAAWRLEAADATRGVAVAAMIITLWASAQVAWLALPWSGAWWALAPLAVLAQTFLHTGLFITAHDAMHGTVCWTDRRLNDAVGALCVRLYAMFSFKKLLAAHRLHHQHPASADDPDYHDGEHEGFARWYLAFLMRYVSWRQLALMALVFNVLAHGVGVPEPRLLALWVLPSVLSTVQLFYFGTYLPHREPRGGYPVDEPHRARSNDYPVWWSFLTCYHFGYHLEHHERPGVPWWRLPRVYRHRRATAADDVKLAPGV